VVLPAAAVVVQLSYAGAEAGIHQVVAAAAAWAAAVPALAPCCVPACQLHGLAPTGKGHEWAPCLFYVEAVAILTESAANKVAEQQDEHKSQPAGCDLFLSRLL
jgi:hypothetical protein